MMRTESAALKACCGGAADQQPGGQGHQGDDEHGGDEDARDPVGQPLHRRLLVLGVLDQPHHVRQLGVPARPSWPGPPGDRRPTPCRRPPGRRGPRRREGTRRSWRCGRWPSARRRPRRRWRRSPPVGRRTGRPPRAAPPEAGVRRPTASSTATSLAPTAARERRALPGPALGPGLEVPAGEEEGGHAGGDVDVDGTPRLVGEDEEDRSWRTARCPARTWRTATNRWPPRCRATRGCPWWTSRAGRCGRPPCRRAMRPRSAPGAARATSSHCQSGKRKRGTSEKAIERSHRGMKRTAATTSRRPSERVRRSTSSAWSVVCVGVLDDLGGVPDALDLLHQPVDRYVGRERDPGPLRRVVDTGLDAVEGVEPPFDPSRAGSAASCRRWRSTPPVREVFERSSGVAVTTLPVSCPIGVLTCADIGLTAPAPLS